MELEENNKQGIYGWCMLPDVVSLTYVATGAQNPFLGVGERY
jgi:hypothetical protein